MKKYGKRFAVLLAGLGVQVGLLLGLTAPAGATSGGQVDVQAKVTVGKPDAEVSPASDPILACGPHPADKDPSGWAAAVVKV